MLSRTSSEPKELRARVEEGGLEAASSNLNASGFAWMRQSIQPLSMQLDAVIAGAFSLEPATVGRILRDGDHLLVCGLHPCNVGRGDGHVGGRPFSVVVAAIRRRRARWHASATR